MKSDLNNLLCALRTKIIKACGGYTSEEVEEKRSLYEKWSMEYLQGKNGEVVPDCSFYFPFEDDDIMVLRSRINISNAKIKGLKVAPWCRDVVTSGLRTQ